MSEAKTKLIEVKNVLVINVFPKKEFNILIEMPTQEIRFEIKGINAAIANAIRRTIYGELPIKRLYCNDLKTNDRYKLEFYLATKIRNMTIDQKINIDENISFDFKNHSPNEMIATTNSFKSNKRFWNSNFPIFSVNGISMLRSVVPKNEPIYVKSAIKVISKIGREHGAHNQCSHVSHQPIDVPPATYGGPSSTEAMPTHFYFKCYSNGGYEPTTLLEDVCDNLIMRLRNVEKDAQTLERNVEYDDIYYFEVIGETYTIAGLLYYELVLHIVPGTTFLTYSVGENSFMMRGREKELSVLVSEAVESLVKKLTHIKKQFSAKIVDCYGVDEVIKTARGAFKHLPLLNDPASDIKGTPNEFGAIYVHV